MLYFDFSVPYQMLFQDSATPMMNGIIDLHHYIMFFLIFILMFVMIALFIIVKTFIYQYDPKELESDIVENKFLIRKNRKHIYRFYNKKNAYKFFERKVGVKTYWNYFWNSLVLASKDNLYVKRMQSADIFELKPFLFEPFDNKALLYVPQYQRSIRSKLKKPIKINWVVPTNIVSKYAMVLLQEDTVKESSKKKHFSEVATPFIAGLYLTFNSHTQEFPDILHARAKNALGRRFVPEKSRHRFIKVILGYTDLELAAVCNPYNLNFFYWLQTYTSIKSGLYKFTHSTMIEIIWTILPSLILVFIGIPSFILLYAMDEIIEPDFVIKCIGHQWYWSYEVEYPDVILSPEINQVLLLLSDDYVAIEKAILEDNELLKEKLLSFFVVLKFLKENDVTLVSINNMLSEFSTDMPIICDLIRSLGINVEDLQLAELEKLNEIEIPESIMFKDLDLRWVYSNFSSYMVNEAELLKGKPRLLEVDNPLYIPIETHIDLLITSNDVLHSWGVPSFGVKCDAVPGRLNHANLFVERPGVFYGQCSELCGVNHGFMPIKVVGVTLEEFFSQVSQAC